MDQLRKAWGWLQRQHFWVLTIVACAVALFCWWRGANRLYAEYVANKSKIEQEFTAQNGLRSQPFHANTSIQEAQKLEIASQQKSVNELWKQLYERQTAEVLKWPSNLSQEFRDTVDRLKFGEDIRRDLRAHYNNYIRDHFPELPKIVGALDSTEGLPGGAIDVRSLMNGGRNNRGGGDDEPLEEPDYIVVWADQDLVRSELYPGLTPSSKRIWKTQEDLWVYEALLRIIANTNQAAGADRFSNAAVRVIESLEVGRTAAQASRGRGRIDINAAPVAAGGEMGEMGAEGAVPMESRGGYGGEMGGYGGEMGRGGYGGEMAGGRGGATDPAASDAELFNGRYVDAAGAPIMTAAVVSEDGSVSSGGGEIPISGEFKRLPVRMQLWMDQAWLPQLITECANAPLQVEVQEVRINPSESSGTGGGYGGSRSGGYSMGSDMGADSGEPMTPDPNPNMKTLVLQGTVYIFNPPTDATATEQVATAE